MFPSGIDGPVITQYHEEHHIGADGGKWKTKLSDESKFGHAHWIQENKTIGIQNSKNWVGSNGGISYAQYGFNYAKINGVG